MKLRNSYHKRLLKEAMLHEKHRSLDIAKTALAEQNDVLRSMTTWIKFSLIKYFCTKPMDKETIKRR